MHATKHPFSDVINQLVYQGKQRKHLTDTCALHRTTKSTHGKVQRCASMLLLKFVSRHTSFSFLTYQFEVLVHCQPKGL